MSSGAQGGWTGEVPPQVDVERANVARIYDYWLGGAHHFAVDRERAELIAAVNPGAVASARANRAFLARATTWCLEQGLDQFLDLGSGVPTVGNVHEVAHRHDPDARIAYVDVEPVAVACAAELLRTEDRATVTRADLRDAEDVLAAPGVAGLLDFDRPVAVLAVAVLHYVPGSLPEVLAPYRERMAPGSVLVVSHVSDDQPDPGLTERIRAAAVEFRGTASEVALRSRAEITAGFGGLDLVEPGLVAIDDWPAPSPDAEPVGFYAAVGRVRG